ncbi:hypothetical protein BO85DRAFT_5091 [Aspergillus piperis CBS 112811]|uniref:Uncharacterized protein n=1 Tax=Aspergillus piperis CBS 112811 TaxID=1448313 RepID=A0A8G1RCR3_9EURO|nr:hypothetical protein BO85DRAFT_5091 [Aspergillus piperis CBS 112811]RAH62667.1 hypothetical protein BO85DRAFT_5091 [Aspergillus piperis CBS 112811]
MHGLAISVQRPKEERWIEVPENSGQWPWGRNLPSPSSCPIQTAGSLPCLELGNCTWFFRALYVSPAAPVGANESMECHLQDLNGASQYLVYLKRLKYEADIHGILSGRHPVQLLGRCPATTSYGDHPPDRPQSHSRIRNLFSRLALGRLRPP